PGNSYLCTIQSMETTPHVVRNVMLPRLMMICRMPNPMNETFLVRRRIPEAIRRLALLSLLAASCTGYAEKRFQVLTRSYDNQRTGANVSEKKLKPANVNPSQFGKLFMLPVDDQVYAGLLYAANVPIAGKKHNV